MRPADPSPENELLLRRYLKLVAFWLPRGERRDIVAELEGEIRAAWQDEERALGRALDAAELEGLLERWGHPMRIAGRYLPHRHLIGPELFPLYLFALRTVALLYLLPWLLVWLGLVLASPAYRAAHPGWELVGTLSTLVTIAFTAFGGLTLAFALLERSHARSGLLPEWNPRHLCAERDPELVPRTESGLQLVTHLVFLAWWLSPVALPEQAGGGIGADIGANIGANSDAAGVWVALHARLFVPVLVLVLGGALLACVHWIRPRWTRARLAARATLDALRAAVALWALTDFLDVRAQVERFSAAKLAGDESSALAACAHLAAFAVLLVLACVFSLLLARALLRLCRWRPPEVRAGLALAVLAAGFALGGHPHAQESAATGLSTDAELEELLRDRIDVLRKNPGTVVGIVSPAGRRILARGRLAVDDPRAVDGDTVFEIGSVTKVFTALLLADMVERGEVALGDPLARCLPEGVTVPERGRPITLLDLATQTSGLPFWPSNLVQSEDGLARYSDVDLYDFLGNCVLALRSTANDLLAFLAACTGLVESPLAPALRAQLATRRPGPGLEQALGWWVISLAPGDAGIVSHGGATHGFACTLAFDPAQRTGVVVLSNGVADDGGFAWHVLRPAFPVASSAATEARHARTEVTLAPAVLERYAGRYLPSDGAELTLELREGALWFVSTAVSGGLRLHAADERTFFATEAELEIVLETDAAGRAGALRVRFAGGETRATRIESRDP